MKGLVTGLGLENYAHVLPPPGFLPFNRAGAATVAPNTPLSNPSIVVTLPQGSGRQGYLFQIGVQLGSSNGIWSLLANGQGLPDYTAINTSLGSPSTPVPALVKLPASQLITLAVANTGGVNMAVSWRLWGWYLPQ